MQRGRVLNNQLMQLYIQLLAQMAGTTNLAPNWLCRTNVGRACLAYANERWRRGSKSGRRTARCT